MRCGLEVEELALNDRLELGWGGEGIEKVKNDSQVSGKRNWMDGTETGNSRREGLKGRIKSAVSDITSLTSVRFP